MCNHKVLIIRDLFVWLSGYCWFGTSFLSNFFVILKTWQFSQKKNLEKIILNLHKKKKIPREKKNPQKFPNLFVDKTTKLVAKKSLVQYQTNMLGVGTLAKVLLTPIFYIMPSHCFDMYYYFFFPLIVTQPMLVKSSTSMIKTYKLGTRYLTCVGIVGSLTI